MTTEKVGAENHVARFEIGREPVSIRDANRFVDYSIPPPLTLPSRSRARGIVTTALPYRHYADFPSGSRRRSDSS